MKFLASPALPALAANPGSAVAGNLYFDTGTKLVRAYDGTVWRDVGEPDWVTYTPTITGYTNVTLARTGRYRVINKTCIGWAQWNVTAITTLGTATLGVSLPLTISSNYAGSAMHIGSLEYRTNAGAYTMGHLSASAGGNSVTFLMHLPGGTSVNMSRATGSIPSGQVVGDHWFVNFCYETA